MRQQEKEKEKEKSKNVSNIQVDYNSMHKVCACVDSATVCSRKNTECVCENVKTCVDMSAFVHHTFMCTHVSCTHANILADTRILKQTYKHEQNFTKQQICAQNNHPFHPSMHKNAPYTSMHIIIHFAAHPRENKPLSPPQPHTQQQTPDAAAQEAAAESRALAARKVELRLHTR